MQNAERATAIMVKGNMFTMTEVVTMVYGKKGNLMVLGIHLIKRGILNMKGNGEMENGMVKGYHII